MNAKIYRVVLNCEGFELSIDDNSPTKMGFFTTWFVRAHTERAAEYRAISLEWDAWAKEDVIPEEQRAGLTVFVDQIAPGSLWQWLRRRRHGYTFYACDTDDRKAKDT
ncbi:MAG: hypothetical protein AAGH41_09890 [Pseudomonadota bacterium]